MREGLPELNTLSRWLDVAPGAENRFDEALLGPVGEFLSTPGKGFRGELVEISYALLRDGGPSAWLSRGKTLLEQLHAGSLVVDDIEDGSELRRGRPTLHRSYGVPLALNAGNWLYFWPLEQVREWGLTPRQERDLYRLVHRCLSRAHFGQALDVGVHMDNVPEAEVVSLCLASLQLKTGALTALATGIGALLGESTSQVQTHLENFGRDFGVALQMLDDLGNATGWRQAPEDPKRFEDLRLGRPSWVWAAAVECGELGSLKEAVARLPDTEPLEAWLQSTTVVAHGRGQAEKMLRTSMERIHRDYAGRGVLVRLEALVQRLLESYR